MNGLFTEVKISRIIYSTKYQQGNFEETFIMIKLAHKMFTNTTRCNPMGVAKVSNVMFDCNDYNLIFFLR